MIIDTSDFDFGLGIGLFLGIAIFGITTFLLSINDNPDFTKLCINNFGSLSMNSNYCLYNGEIFEYSDDLEKAILLHNNK